MTFPDSYILNTDGVWKFKEWEFTDQAQKISKQHHPPKKTQTNNKQREVSTTLALHIYVQCVWIYFQNPGHRKRSQTYYILYHGFIVGYSLTEVIGSCKFIKEQQNLPKQQQKTQNKTNQTKPQTNKTKEINDQTNKPKHSNTQNQKKQQISPPVPLCT